MRPLSSHTTLSLRGENSSTTTAAVDPTCDDLPDLIRVESEPSPVVHDAFGHDFDGLNFLSPDAPSTLTRFADEIHRPPVTAVPLTLKDVPKKGRQVTRALGEAGVTRVRNSGSSHIQMRASDGGHMTVPLHGLGADVTSADRMAVRKALQASQRDQKTAMSSAAAALSVRDLLHGRDAGRRVDYVPGARLRVTDGSGRQFTGTVTATGRGTVTLDQLAGKGVAMAAEFNVAKGGDAMGPCVLRTDRGDRGPAFSWDDGTVPTFGLLARLAAGTEVTIRGGIVARYLAAPVWNATCLVKIEVSGRKAAAALKDIQVGTAVPTGKGWQVHLPFHDAQVRVPGDAQEPSQEPDDTASRATSEMKSSRSPASGRTAPESKATTTTDDAGTTAGPTPPSAKIATTPALPALPERPTPPAAPSPSLAKGDMIHVPDVGWLLLNSKPGQKLKLTAPRRIDTFEQRCERRIQGDDGSITYTFNVKCPAEAGRAAQRTVARSAQLHGIPDGARIFLHGVPCRWCAGQIGKHSFAVYGRPDDFAHLPPGKRPYGRKSGSEPRLLVFKADAAAVSYVGKSINDPAFVSMLTAPGESGAKALGPVPITPRMAIHHDGKHLGFLVSKPGPMPVGMIAPSDSKALQGLQGISVGDQGDGQIVEYSNFICPFMLPADATARRFLALPTSYLACAAMIEGTLVQLVSKELTRRLPVEGLPPTAEPVVFKGDPAVFESWVRSGDAVAVQTTSEAVRKSLDMSTDGSVLYAVDRNRFDIRLPIIDLEEVAVIPSRTRLSAMQPVDLPAPRSKLIEPAAEKDDDDNGEVFSVVPDKADWHMVNGLRRLYVRPDFDKSRRYWLTSLSGDMPLSEELLTFKKSAQTQVKGAIRVVLIGGPAHLMQDAGSMEFALLDQSEKFYRHPDTPDQYQHLASVHILDAGRDWAKRFLRRS